MADKSAIEWCQATLNAWTGCRKVSAGCARCFIEHQPPFRIAGRKFVKGVTVAPDGSGPVVYHLDRIDRMVRRKKPTVYFVNSLSDVFLEDVPWGVIAYLFAGMAASPQHTHQVLTKRPERMQELLSEDRFWDQVRVEAEAEGWSAQPCGPGTPLPNVWLGVTVENRAQVGRADLLRATPAAVRFLSCEPLIGPLRATSEREVEFCENGDGRTFRADEIRGSEHKRWWTETRQAWTDGKLVDNALTFSPGSGTPELDLSGIDWCIAGGESGPGARPCRVEWLRDLRDACLAESFRRIDGPGGPGPYIGELSERPEPLELPGPCWFFLKQLGGHPDKRGGDKAVLDGRLWHDMPPLHSPEPAQGALL